MCLRSLLPCATQRPKSNVTIFVAYVEVYNEDVYDLLDSKKGRTKLKIHKTTRVCLASSLTRKFVPRLTLPLSITQGLAKPWRTESVAATHDASAFQRIMQFRAEGDERRFTGSTAMNEKSSRRSVAPCR